MKTISPKALKSRMDAGDDLQIIDIRETYEVDSGSLGGQHIPMGEVKTRLSELRKDCPLVVHCRSGKRAKAVAHYLESELGFDNVHVLSGGIEAWARDIDPRIEVF